MSYIVNYSSKPYLYSLEEVLDLTPLLRQASQIWSTLSPHHPVLIAGRTNGLTNKATFRSMLSGAIINLARSRCKPGSSIYNYIHMGLTAAKSPSFRSLAYEVELSRRHLPPFSNRLDLLRDLQRLLREAVQISQTNIDPSHSVALAWLPFHGVWEESVAQRLDEWMRIITDDDDDDHPSLFEAQDAQDYFTEDEWTSARYFYLPRPTNPQEWIDWTNLIPQNTPGRDLFIPIQPTHEYFSPATKEQLQNIATTHYNIIQNMTHQPRHIHNIVTVEASNLSATRIKYRLLHA